MLKLILLLLTLSCSLFLAQEAQAAKDPRLFPNNKFGINTLSPEAEIDETHALVNTNGDWGYVVVTIKKTERDTRRWQNFLNQARDKHLIPVFRLATEFDENNYWQKPGEKDHDEWATFFSKLHFPTKNRYIQVYNEVNRATEWGGEVDPVSYAKELDRTIDAFKKKNDDFFILNAPLDLALASSTDSLDASVYFYQMEDAVPGIFQKIDGWASHSYPNPDFSSSPYKSGRTGIRGFEWELFEIGKYTSGKDLPVFLTETGWKRNEVLNEDTISEYYKVAFTNVWNDSRIVAVAPFVLGYPEPLFQEFSFKKPDLTKKEFYKYFDAVRNLQKNKGKPERENSAIDFKIFTPTTITKGEEYYVTVSFRNRGNHVWEKNNLKIEITGENFTSKIISLNEDRFFPDEQVLAILKIRSDFEGSQTLKLNILDNDQVLSQGSIWLRSELEPFLILEKIKSLI